MDKLAKDELERFKPLPPKDEDIRRHKKIYHPKRRTGIEQVLDILKEIPGVYDRIDFHKPKLSSHQKLSYLCSTLPIRDAITPQILHVLRRYFEKQIPGNEFESKIFQYLDRLDEKSLQALRFALKVFDDIPENLRYCLFNEQYLKLPLDHPISADTLAYHWIHEAEILGTKVLHNTTTISGSPGSSVGKVRPWEQEVPDQIDPKTSKKVIAPWPWINSVNDFRTPNHRELPEYFEAFEYDKDVEFSYDPNTQELISTEKDLLFPNCEVYNYQHKGMCMRIPVTRPNQTVRLVGFNFFSKDCKVRLQNIQNSYYEYTLDTLVYGDPSTDIKQADGTIIADHRVTDSLVFQVPSKTPDGLYSFVPGIYSVSVIVPNEVNYNLANGYIPKDFGSNTAYIKVRPLLQANKYRIWVDEGYCAEPTDGEWSSDEIYLRAIPVMMKPGDKEPKFNFPIQETYSWDDVDRDDFKHNWNWNIVGEPNNPFEIEGCLAIGLIGYEIDSEDALKEQVMAFSDAYIKYIKMAWSALSDTGAISGAVSLLKSVSLKIAAIIAGTVIAAILLVGVIYAAWAPADKILLDIIVLTEEDLFFLTDPRTPKPQWTHEYGIIDPDTNRSITPLDKQFYLYSEYREYQSVSCGSRYGFTFMYKRDQ